MAESLPHDQAPAAPEPAFVSMLRRVDKALARVEEVALAAFLLALILLAVYQAYKRNLAPPSPYWTDEVIRYAVFSIGLLGAALASQSGRLMNIDLVVRLLPLRVRVFLRIFATLVTLVACWFLWKGSLHVRAVNIRLHEHGEVITPATGILIMPIAAALIGVHLTLHAIIDAYYLALGMLPPDADDLPVH